MPNQVRHLALPPALWQVFGVSDTGTEEVVVKPEGGRRDSRDGRDGGGRGGGRDGGRGRGGDGTSSDSMHFACIALLRSLFSSAV